MYNTLQYLNYLKMVQHSYKQPNLVLTQEFVVVCTVGWSHSQATPIRTQAHTGAQFILVEVVRNLSETETTLSSAKNVTNGTIYIALAYPHHPTTPLLTKVPSGSATYVEFHILPLLHLEMRNQILTTPRLTAPTSHTSQNAGLIVYVRIW